MLGSRTSPRRSLAESPFTMPLVPQWYGSPTRWVLRPWTTSGASRSVTSTRLYRGAHRDDRGPPSVGEADLLCELRADLAEHLGHELRETLCRAAHASPAV